MKKIIVLFTAVTLIITLSLGAAGGYIISEISQHETKRIQNIAGAVVSEYPETEDMFAAAVMDGEFKDLKNGKIVMTRYGFGGDTEREKRYHKEISAYVLIVALMLFCTLLWIYTALFFIWKKKKSQEESFLVALDKCLSDEYGFINDDRIMGNFENTIFSDSFAKLSEKLRLKTEALNEERDNTKSLVTDISHQLKTPISAMKACFDIYAETDSKIEREEFLKRSRIQMDKMEALAASLINISRLENSMIVLSKEEVSLQEIIIGAVNTIYHKAASKNIDIITSDFEDITLKLDFKWTVEAIANVLDNGIKYSPRDSEIHIRITKMFSFVRIEIEDRGIGISKADRNNVFKRFFRGSSDKVKKEEGSGVGLYITRKIIEEQGGTISVKSSGFLQGSCGSIFIIQLLI